ncbi:MAG TPA: hypothetical protein VE824_00380 [Gaiellales bacterium]|nr:hypothetical protein [Gaiellales bacterium]
MAETPERDAKEREQEASEVLERRRDDLPSQRNVNSPEAGRAPRDTEFEHPNKDEEI